MSAKKAGVSDPEPPVEATPPNGQTAASKRRVLIVDDSETACKQIQIFLETDPGISVDTASTAAKHSKLWTNDPTASW